MDIKKVTVVISYDTSATIDAIVDGLLDIPGVQGTFVPSGQDHDAMCLF